MRSPLFFLIGLSSLIIVALHPQPIESMRDRIECNKILIKNSSLSQEQKEKLCGCFSKIALHNRQEGPFAMSYRGSYCAAISINPITGLREIYYAHIDNPLTASTLAVPNSDTVTALAFSPDERYLLAGVWNKTLQTATLKIWDITTPQENRSWYLGQILSQEIYKNRQITAIALAPDYSHLALGAHDKLQGSESLGIFKKRILPSNYCNTFDFIFVNEMYLTTERVDQIAFNSDSFAISLLTYDRATDASAIQSWTFNDRLKASINLIQKLEFPSKFLAHTNESYYSLEPGQQDAMRCFKQYHVDASVEIISITDQDAVLIAASQDDSHIVFQAAHDVTIFQHYVSLPTPLLALMIKLWLKPTLIIQDLTPQEQALYFNSTEPIKAELSRYQNNESLKTSFCMLF